MISVSNIYTFIVSVFCADIMLSLSTVEHLFEESPLKMIVLFTKVCTK